MKTCDFFPSGYLLSDVWIGLYGNGTHLVWQNMKTTVTYSDFQLGANINNYDVGFAMDKIEYTWKPRLKTAILEHALCQCEFSFVVTYEQ